MKSGKDKRSKSLNILLKEKDRRRTGIKLADGNIFTDDNGAVHLPLYGACFLKEEQRVRDCRRRPVGYEQKVRSAPKKPDRLIVPTASPVQLPS